MNYNLQNIEELKAFAAAAKTLETVTPNKHWKKAYRDLRRGCDALWRLQEQIIIKGK